MEGHDVTIDAAADGSIEVACSCGGLMQRRFWFGPLAMAYIDAHLVIAERDQATQLLLSTVLDRSA